ncbi:MAG: alpha/beta hydrolase [Pseudomonadota bacterium]
MAKLKANGIEIEYEDHGDPSNPAILLIMGLAAQLTHWPPAFIDALTAQSYRVIAFDNRDIGLSEKLHAKRAPKPTYMAAARLIGLKRLAPYTLRDMARDAASLLKKLDIDSAHVVGVSMGGMIGQVLSAEHRARVKSFTAIMSSTNNPRLPKADPAIVREIFATRTRPRTRDELIDRTVGIWDMIGTKNGGNDPALFREKIAAAVDRCTYPAGIRRQIAAIIATGDLRSFSKKVTAPTLVIHGTEDPLVPFKGGLDIAASIPNARAELIDGMGHDLPPVHLDRIIDLVADHVASAEEKAVSEKAA